jgi:sec-independent protein translocase protein TatC
MKASRVLPHLVDMPMSLGDHLGELRRRLIVPIVVLGVGFVVAFIYQKELKVLFVKPLLWAIQMDPAAAARAGLPTDGSLRVLHSFDLSESALVSVSVSVIAALVVTIPVLIHQLWGFVAVALKPRERNLAFLFVPVGVICFYLGAVLGYFYALPIYYAWLIEWAASDPTATQLLRQNAYLDSFVLMTVCFGFIMDIPWLVVVLVRVGLITPDQLARYRRLVIVINATIAALIAPPDGASMIAMMIPLQLLFEGGLLASRLMLWRNKTSEARDG